MPTHSVTPPALSVEAVRKGWKLSTQIQLPQGPEQVFPFFADAANLEKLTPAYLHFETLTPLPMEMRKGSLIDYRLRLHGVPIRWQTEITEWDPPFRFVDTQIQGPYRWWVHEHRFLENDSGTLAVDEVLYAMRFGWLLHPLFIKRELVNIFSHRAQVLHELFIEGKHGRQR